MGGTGQGTKVTTVLSAAAGTIETLENILAYLKVANQYFVINAACDGLVLTYTGAATTVDIPDGTYSATGLAAAMKIAIDAALGCTCSVAYDSTSRKFSITVSDNTIAYTHAGSDAGLMIGFTQDHAAASAIVGDVAVGDPTDMVSVLHLTAENMIKAYCATDLVSSTYYEYHDGWNNTLDESPFREIGGPVIPRRLDDFNCFIQVRNFPITSVKRFCLGTQDAITIYNDDEYMTATVSVTSSGIVLEKDGTENALGLFTTYTTMADLVAYVNTLGNGWAAELMDTQLATVKSSELLERYGASAIDATRVYLEIPGRAQTEFKVSAKQGRIYFAPGIPKGYSNVYVVYTAGHTDASMPTRLKDAVKMQTMILYNKYRQKLFGFDGYNLGALSVQVNKETLSNEVKMLLAGSKRWVL
jgi:hypothetical protein